MNMELHQWIGIVIGTISAIATGLWAWHKWQIARDDANRDQINSAQDRTLQAHKDRLDRHREHLNRLDEIMQRTRDEMASHYVRLEHIEKLEHSIDGKIERIHTRLSGIARDLNQAIGTLRSSHDTQITKLIEQIKDALEQRQH